MRSPALRFGLFVALVVMGLAVAYQLGLVEWLRANSLHELMVELRGHWWTPLALLGLLIAAGSFPIPATIAILASGAIYGPLRGWLLNWFGCLLSAGIGYLLARVLGRDFVEKIVGVERWAKLEGLVAEHGMWTMIRARWFLPFVAANFAGGLSGLGAARFLLASAIGLSFPLAIYTYAGHILVSSVGGDPTRTLRNAAALVLGLLALSLVRPGLRWLRSRRGS